MQIFTTPEQYKNMISDFKKRNKGLIQNCYYMFDEVKKLIDEMRLSYILEDDVLLIFRDERKYYNVSFLVSKDSDAMKINADKPCTTGIIHKGDTETPKVAECRKAAEKLGFQFAHCNRMYETDIEDRLLCLKDEYAGLLKSMNQCGLERRMYEECYFPEVRELWENYLTEFNIPVEDWDIYIRESILIVDEKSQKELCGIVMPKLRSNENICHLVVNPLYWEKKLDVILHYNALEVLRDKGLKEAKLWIADDNIFSLKYHRKYLNIRDTGLKSYQYVI